MFAKPIVLATTLIVLTSLSTAAQNNIEKKVDRIVNAAMKADNFPGLAVAIVQDGKLVMAKGYGVRSINDGVAPDANTVFSIGSVSKAFTAVGLMTLVQDGKISLDDPIGKYMKNLPKEWQDITIRQFMTHTSGIPDLQKIKDDESFGNSLALAAKQNLAFKPGTRQMYNNFNFAIMGKLIETVSGMAYLPFMRAKIFDPLGMSSTGVKPASSDLSTGHMERNGKLVAIQTHFKPNDYGVPSGGLQTTLNDFVKLSQALTSTSLLRKKTINAMWTPYSQRLTNTPGWHSRMAGNEIIIHKGGGGTGIGSVCDFKIVPSRNICVVIMINKAKNNGNPSTLTDDILSKCFGIPASTGDDQAGEGNER